MNFASDFRLIQWSFVKGIASNDLSRVVGLIPLAGYLVLFNDEIANLVSFDIIAGAGNKNVSPFILGSLLKLRLVFFGSLLVFFSFLVYRCFRPSVLENSNGDLEFSTRVRDTYSVHEIAAMEVQVFSENWQPRTEAFWLIHGKIRSKTPVVSGYRPDVRSSMFGKHSDYIHFLAREWWAGMMHTFRVARLASMSMGIIGYAMLAIPTMDIAQAVLRDILGY